MKEKTLIVWQDGHPELERMAAYLGEKLAGTQRDVIVRMASAVTIPEVLAASSYLFGADAAGSDSYDEIARLMRGINLAGRAAAFFGTNGAAVAWLREMTKDAELITTTADLVGTRPDQNSVAAILRAFA
ncbi:MAG TPA: hypothetical protein VMV44_05345 [Rectinemataceae bacterium]|nr:hypothetical protein [Rectinemataceae bacterium]